jgi:hypothetical protein
MGALDIEMDVNVAPSSTPRGASYLRIHGVGVQDISQAVVLRGKNIEVFGGMTKGLPLANPAQAGLLFSGQIFQAFANWVGTEQTLDMYFAPAIGTPTDPKNIVFNWLKGTTIKDAITNTLNVAFPGVPIRFQTTMASSGLGAVLPNDEQGYYQSLTQFGTYVKNISQAIANDYSSGVEIVYQQNGILVFDGTSLKSPREISYTDLIGQPTWIQSPTVIFQTVMRADIQVADFIRLPPGPTITTAASASNFIDHTSFSGVFAVKTVRHVGNFRQPMGASWATIFEANPASATTAPTTGALQGVNVTPPAQNSIAANVGATVAPMSVG